MASSADRQRAFKARRAATGLVQCNVWVPAACAAELKLAAELMVADPDLRVARLMDVKTGRLRGLKPSLVTAAANQRPSLTDGQAGQDRGKAEMQRAADR
jgi:hypothetical protein